MSTLFWIVVAVALVWVVSKLSRSTGSSDTSDSGSSTFFAVDSGTYSDGGSTGSDASCSDSGGDSGGDGGSCDGGSSDGGGGD